MRQMKTNLRNKEEYVSPETEVFYITLGLTVMSPFDTPDGKSIDEVEEGESGIPWNN